MDTKVSGRQRPISLVAFESNFDRRGFHGFQSSGRRQGLRRRSPHRLHNACAEVGKTDLSIVTQDKHPLNDVLQFPVISRKTITHEHRRRFTRQALDNFSRRLPKALGEMLR